MRKRKESETREERKIIPRDCIQLATLRTTGAEFL